VRIRELAADSVVGFGKVATPLNVSRHDKRRVYTVLV
jgi:hypothetical protein